MMLSMQRFNMRLTFWFLLHACHLFMVATHEEKPFRSTLDENLSPPRRVAEPVVTVVTTEPNPVNLGQCEGDCDKDEDCANGLVCFQRDAGDSVPGCVGGDTDRSRTDYCVQNSANDPSPFESPSSAPSDTPTAGPSIESSETPTASPPSLPDTVPSPPPSPTPSTSEASGAPTAPTATPSTGPSSNPTLFKTSSPSLQPTVPPPTNPPNQVPTGVMPKLVSYGGTPPSSKLPLGLCEGDCDNDTHCNGGLVCFQRGPNEPVPGCDGNDASRTDYCINPEGGDATIVTPCAVTGYTPGKLTVSQAGLLLSEGLDARLIATTGQVVDYASGASSTASFHGRPDAGATFADTRDDNPGGWVYVSNAEMRSTGQGGVGAITFDAQGNIIDYRMVLEGTTMNCGGGRTPWNTWVSCEERQDRQGHLYQVDPFGNKPSEQMSMASHGGQWESFAYDDRDPNNPTFYVTEDHNKGALLRFSPHTPDWNSTWDMLHGTGTTEYLILMQTSPDKGTFYWTDDRVLAMENAKDQYPHSEGIDVYGPHLFFVCKKLKLIYTLDLDGGTWNRTSTVSGLFDGQPDQMKRILTNPRDLLYFTEEGGKDAGVHARDANARFYTIFESPVYPGETTGLSLSPNGKYMYVAYQDVGKLFSIWRCDGEAFNAEHLDVKYHDGM